MRLEDDCIVGCGKKKRIIGKKITKRVKRYVKSRNRTQLPYSSDVEKIIRRRQGKLIDEQAIPIPVTIVPRRDLSGKISEFLKIQDLIQPATPVEAPAAAPAAAPDVQEHLKLPAIKSIREYLERIPKPKGYNKIRNSVAEIERWLWRQQLVEAVDEGIKIGLTRDDFVAISNEMAPVLRTSSDSVMGRMIAAMPREEEVPVPIPREEEVPVPIPRPRRRN